MKEITPGLTHTSTTEVTPELTAEAMGSGDMPVLATPAMVALMENAAMRAVAPCLDDSSTTVGGHIDASHLKASPVGAKVSAHAVLTAAEGRKLTFEIEAREGDTVIGKASHLRFIVDRERFMGGLK
ncbi:MAG: thioesterase family protein [Rikenellaceae bacterium]|nr:thioesterase family protein [Rikenellaceae bacterium]